MINNHPISTQLYHTRSKNQTLSDNLMPSAEKIGSTPCLLEQRGQVIIGLLLLRRPLLLAGLCHSPHPVSLPHMGTPSHVVLRLPPTLLHPILQTEILRRLDLGDYLVVLWVFEEVLEHIGLIVLLVPLNIIGVSECFVSIQDF